MPETVSVMETGIGFSYMHKRMRTGAMAVAIDRRKTLSGVNPATGRPRTVIGSLRNVAACALGGAVVAGALFGHDAGGFDPGELGAVAGAVAGLIGWASGRL